MQSIVKTRKNNRKSRRNLVGYYDSVAYCLNCWAEQVHDDLAHDPCAMPYEHRPHALTEAQEYRHA